MIDGSAVRGPDLQRDEGADRFPGQMLLLPGRIEDQGVDLSRAPRAERLALLAPVRFLHRQLDAARDVVLERAPRRHGLRQRHGLEAPLEIPQSASPVGHGTPAILVGDGVGRRSFGPVGGRTDLDSPGPVIEVPGGLDQHRPRGSRPHQGRGGPGVGAGNRVGVEAQGGLGSTSRATRQGKNEEAACHDLGRFQGKGGHLASIGFAWARLEPRNPGRSARGSVDPVAALEGPSRCCWQVI